MGSLQMDVNELYNKILLVESRIKSAGLIGEVCIRMNWCGDKFMLDCSASEPYNSKGYWKRTRILTCEPTDEQVDEVFRKALAWANMLPNQRDRAIETMLIKIRQMVDTLPDGASGDDIIDAAWDELRKMLLARAKDLADNALSSPQMMPILSKVVTEDDEIPF